MRADGRRNRELVLAAARASFAERGPDVTVAEIAKRAGVGSATLFRHFATKDDLMAAALEEVLEQIVVGLDEAQALSDPWDSFVRAVTVIAELQSTDQMFLKAAGPALLSEERFATASDTLWSSMSAVVERAQAAGVVRADLEPSDLPFIFAAVGGATDQCRGPVAPADLWRRYLGLMLDGLRPEGAHPLPAVALTDDELHAVKGASHH